MSTRKNVPFLLRFKNTFRIPGIHPDFVVADILKKCLGTTVSISQEK